ncbi:hypothetical protein C1645_834604 [Glomus cerebriforme]|uniref:MULE transposase domain-containing protein n=1 Tax=Glomus cerebriforme TaxID=658196 RepID=A0A397SDG2_9GLOM|nr:hypothetical protein C1645_834604 [Glomus cerebriforme]
MKGFSWRLQNTYYSRADRGVSKKVFEYRHAGKPKPTLLSDETSASYIWVLEQLLKANHRIIPTVIISDADTGENYNDFLSKFYSAQNSLNEAIFEIKWNQLIETFPLASNYLTGTLDKIKESWVKAFICMTTKAEYRDWIESLPHVNTSTSASQQIFSRIIEELKKYLTSELYFIQKAQLDISLEYNASLIPLEEYNNIAMDTEQEKQENNSSNPDDQVDVAQISLKSLINKVDWENILEIWHVTYITHNPNSTPHFVIILLDQGHICTCLMILNCGLFKSEIHDNSENLVQNQAFMDVNGNFLNVIRSTILDLLRNEDSNDDINMKIQTRHLYSDLFGIGRKIAQVATEKKRFNVLDVLNNILEELYDTDEGADELNSNRILNPHMGTELLRQPRLGMFSDFLDDPNLEYFWTS